MAIDALPEGFVLDSPAESTRDASGLPAGFVVDKPQPESMMTEGVLGYAAKHPFKTVLQGAAQTITGKSLEERAHELTAPKEIKPGDTLGYVGSVAGETAAGIAGSVADMATSPGTYLAGPVLKVAGNAAGAIGKAVPEGLKQTSYGLMQSIVNQLPKEFKYGANAGRAMVKEKLQGDAADIAEQSAARMKDIGKEGDILASQINTTQDYGKAVKVIDDKIAELQKNAPRENASTINRLQNARKDLLGVVEDSEGKVIDVGQDLSNLTPKEALEFKRKYDYITQWKGVASDDSVVNATLQSSRRMVKDQLNDHVPGMKEWNQRYADLSAANQAAMRRVTYDQAGAGMRNMLNNFVRGSVGLSALGSAITGNGQLAGEILAGWGAKEVIGNPMVKSKVAQMLYNMSETDIKSLVKSAPWISRLMNVNKKSGSYSVKPELMPEGGWNQEIPANNQSRLPGGQPLGLPEPFLGRRGVNPTTEGYAGQGKLPRSGDVPIQQGYEAPKPAGELPPAQFRPALPPTQTKYGEGFSAKLGPTETSTGGVSLKERQIMDKFDFANEQARMAQEGKFTVTKEGAEQLKRETEEDLKGHLYMADEAISEAKKIHKFLMEHKVGKDSFSRFGDKNNWKTIPSSFKAVGKGGWIDDITKSFADEFPGKLSPDDTDGMVSLYTDAGRGGRGMYNFAHIRRLMSEKAAINKELASRKSEIDRLVAKPVKMVKKP